MINKIWLRNQKIKAYAHCLILFAIVTSIISCIYLSQNASAGIDKETLRFFTKNNILYYDDCSNGGSSSSAAGHLSGNSNEEKIWNYLLEKGGITDAKVLSGILGNLQAESSFNPFAYNGTYYGIFQGNDVTWISQVESRVGDHWGEYDASQELQDAALEIELNYLVNDWSRFNEFKADIPRVASQTPSSYAELWMVDVERAVYGSDSVEDSGVYQVMVDMYGGTVYQYQHLARRRQYAEEFFIKYGNSSSTGSSGYSSSSSSTESGSSSDNNIINQTALNLAWDTDGHTGLNDAKPEYKTALEQVGFASSGDQEVSSGRSCDVFVATVMRYSGYDPEFYCCMANDVGSYMASHPEKYELVTPTGGGGYQESDLQPGDILSSPRHVALYVKLSDGTGRVASASHGDRMPDTTRTWDLDNGYHAYPAVYRPKNIPSSSSDSSNTCSNTQNSAGGLVSGGMTLEQAQAFMQPYHDKAMELHNSGWSGDVVFDGALIIDTATYSVMNNCSAFSQWFSNRYTTAGGPNKDQVSIRNGDATVEYLISLDRGYTYGTEPRPYAIFSTHEFNHTGVILGVDTERQVVIVGEASDSMVYEPRAKEWSFKQMQDWRTDYAYTDSILTMN